MSNNAIVLSQTMRFDLEDIKEFMNDNDLEFNKQNTLDYINMAWEQQTEQEEPEITGTPNGSSFPSSFASLGKAFDEAGWL